MKIDLTARDIELLLALLADTAYGKKGFNASIVYSMEELVLIDKLEAALRQETVDEPELMDTGSPSELTH
jgi:hypothetical protein